MTDGRADLLQWEGRLLSAMNSAEAFAAVALAAVACDGVMGHDEARALRGHLECRVPFSGNSEESMGRLFDGLLVRLRREGWRALIHSAMPVLSAPQRETSLAMAAQLVHCDRVVTPQELELLNEMAALTDLPADRAALILDVIAVLNRDCLAG
jgi:hypothetical protein